MGSFRDPRSTFPLLISALIFFLAAFKSDAADVALGSVLRPTDSNASWVSPGETCSLQFFPVDAGGASLYVAAIAFGGIRVWTAGGGSTPGMVDSAASLQLGSDGNLRLFNGSEVLVWESGTAGRGVTKGALLDTGNFVLSNGSTVWDSFSNPTDTLLQNQNFTLNETLRSGPYSFSLLLVGNFTLEWNNTVVYYNKGLNASVVANVNLTSPSLTLQSNGIVTLSDQALATAPVIAYSSDYGEPGELVRFLRLDDDGNLRAYSSVRGTGQATARWSAVTDQCEVFGWCGNMGICSYNDTEPTCGCPSKNFELTEPGDPRKGCRRKQEIKDCPGNSTMLQLDHTQFLTYPPDISTEVFFVGITACRQNCLSGSSCVASTSLADGSGLCYLKVSNFVSGYHSPALPSTSFVKVCSPGIPNQPPLSHQP
uniref:G-type lectin S-receptor-like serine/threonine-protein kinase At1g34300 n=1 Tax=Anthurium amnicola TaxID=1678845 RepID=A0A1D1Y8U2_9ARAE